MFEDAYAKHKHFKKFDYEPPHLAETVASAVKWAEDFLKKFGKVQQAVLPWLSSKP